MSVRQRQEGQALLPGVLSEYQTGYTSLLRQVSAAHPIQLRNGRLRFGKVGRDGGFVFAPLVGFGGSEGVTREAQWRVCDGVDLLVERDIGEGAEALEFTGRIGKEILVA